MNRQHVLFTSLWITSALILTLPGTASGQAAAGRSDRPPAMTASESAKGSPSPGDEVKRSAGGARPPGAESPSPSNLDGDGTSETGSVSNPAATPSADPMTQALLDDPELSKRVTKAYADWLMAYYEGQQRVISDREEVIRATNWISYGICIVVHVLLLAGSWFAFQEYLEARRMRSRNEGDARDTELELSIQKISLKTAQHGTVLLVISVVMYFLYLTFVYPITVVD